MNILYAATNGIDRLFNILVNHDKKIYTKYASLNADADLVLTTSFSSYLEFESYIIENYTYISIEGFKEETKTH